MTAKKQSSVDRVVERKLRRVWRLEQRRHHMGGILALATWAIGFFLCAFAIDLAMLLDLWARMLLLAIGMGLLARVLFLQWLRLLRRFDRRRAAKSIEQQHGELLNLVSTYVELSGPDRENAHGSDELKDLVQGIAVDAAQPVDLHQVVSFSRLRKPLALALWALLAVIVVASFWPAQTRVFAKRLLGAGIPYPTRTTILAITGDRTLKQGAPLTLSLEAGGVVPPFGVLYLKYRNTEWQSIKMDRAAGDSFSFELQSVTASFLYYAEIGDVSSSRHTISVIPPPSAVAIRVRVTPPAYTRVEPYELETWNIEVPEGSRLEWNITTDTELADAELLIGHREPIAATIAGDGRELVANCMADRPLTYRFRWRRRDTHFVYDDPIHRIYVKPDRDPEVAIVIPQADVRATINKTLAMKFRARDDYGITRAWLVHTLNDGKESRMDLGKLPIPEEQASREHPRYGIWPLIWDLKREIPDLKVGDEITYFIEVEDVRAESDGGIRQSSLPHRIRVVSFSEYQNHVYAMLEQTREGLAAVHLEAVKSRQVVEALSKRAGSEGTE
jgi:hypothetical protein